MADLVQYYGTGRRKSAIARVFLRPGTGEWKVNGKAFEEYFVTEQQRVAAKRTLVVAELAASFDVVTTVKSGGVAAQADAVKMGIARALGRVQPGAAQAAQGRRTDDPRRAPEGTQEVRPEGRPQAVPVLASASVSGVSCQLSVSVLVWPRADI